MNGIEIAARIVIVIMGVLVVLWLLTPAPRIEGGRRPRQTPPGGEE